jgi:hypothetical protein
MSDELVKIRAARGAKIETYHTDKSCRQYPDSGHEITRDEAAQRDLRECRICAGENESTDNDPWKYHKLIAEAQADD